MNCISYGQAGVGAGLAPRTGKGGSALHYGPEKGTEVIMTRLIEMKGLGSPRPQLTSPREAKGTSMALWCHQAHRAPARLGSGKDTGSDHPLLQPASQGPLTGQAGTLCSYGF